MRILALVTDAYGAHGGIALCNRDIVESLTAMPEVTEVVVVPRNVPSLPERIPAKVRFVTKAAGGKGRYLLASLSLARRPRSLLFWVYPGFPTIFSGLLGFFVGDFMGKALWQLVENAQRFPRRGGRVLCVHGRYQLPRGSVGDKMAGGEPGVLASSDCGRDAQNRRPAGRTLDLPRKDRDIRYANSDIATLLWARQLAAARHCAQTDPSHPAGAYGAWN